MGRTGKLTPLRVGIFLLIWVSMLGVFAQESAPNNDFTIHVVQRGENLFRIALNYGVDLNTLAAVNGVNNPANIQVGQRLLVPRAGNTTDAARTHIIQAGETLEGIASLYGLDAPSLLSLNSLDPVAPLYVGQILMLPALPAPTPNPLPTSAAETPSGVPSQSTAPPTTELIHIVSANETLFRIGQQYNVDVNQIARANGITDPTRIYVGQQLIIPGIEPPQLIADLPAPLERISVSPQVFTEGKTGTIYLQSTQPITLQGEFLGRALFFYADEGQTTYRTFVGVPTFVNPGIYPLKLTVTPSNTAPFELTANIQVFSGGYGNEIIRLMEGRDNLLNTNVEDAELILLQTATQRITPTPYFRGAMSLPAAAAVTSGFGTRRSYDNGAQYDRYHSGTDFAGVPGTPILAPADGVVILADTLNVRGNATMIDHGLGIYTGYWHQAEIYVQLGDRVQKGQVIGTIGATGRVTGAHLHWELWVNGVPVDPMQWVQQTFIP